MFIARHSFDNRIIAIPFCYLAMYNLQKNVAEDLPFFIFGCILLLMTVYVLKNAEITYKVNFDIEQNQLKLERCNEQIIIPISDVESILKKWTFGKYPFSFTPGKIVTNRKGVQRTYSFMIYGTSIEQTEAMRSLKLALINHRFPKP